MKKKMMAMLAAILSLVMVAAGCGAQTGAGSGAADSGATGAVAEAASTARTAAAEVAAEDEKASWENEDDAYLTGLVASDFVELPEKYDRLTIQAARPVDPTEDEVEARIQTELQNRTTLEESGHKHVREGDTVNIDYVGKIDGEAFDGGTGTYDLVIGSHSFIDGFEEGLIGAKKGETLDLKLAFPKDYHAEELAGKDVVFTVTVNKISESVTPELDDEYVKSLNLTNAFGQAVTDVEDYRDYVRSNMVEEREATYESLVKSQLIDTLVDDCTFRQEPPVHMVDKYNYLLTRQLQYYALQSYTDLPTLMSVYYGATKDNYLDMIWDMAVKYARQGLAFQAVADREDLNPGEDEVTAKIAEYVDSNATIDKAEDLDRVRCESLRDELMTDKVIDWLYDHCEVKEPEEEAEAAGTSDSAEEDGTAADAQAAQTGESAEAAGTSDSAEEDGTAADAQAAQTGESAEAADASSAEESDK